MLNLSHTFPSVRGLKNGTALTPLPLNFVFNYASKKVQKIRCLKLNETKADDINLPRENYTSKKQGTYNVTWMHVCATIVAVEINNYYTF